MRMARVTTSVPYQVRCSYSAKQLVSEVGTWEKMRLEHVLEKWSCIGAERGRSGRPHQPHKCKKKRDFSAIYCTAHAAAPLLQPPSRLLLGSIASVDFYRRFTRQAATTSMYSRADYHWSVGRKRLKERKDGGDTATIAWVGCAEWETFGRLSSTNIQNEANFSENDSRNSCPKLYTQYVVILASFW